MAAPTHRKPSKRAQARAPQLPPEVVQATAAFRASLRRFERTSEQYALDRGLTPRWYLLPRRPAGLRGPPRPAPGLGGRAGRRAGSGVLSEALGRPSVTVIDRSGTIGLNEEHPIGRAGEHPAGGVRDVLLGVHRPTVD